MNWAQRLKRVFAIEIERCQRCGGRLAVIASIEDAALIERILAHVETRAEEEGSRSRLGSASLTRGPMNKMPFIRTIRRRYGVQVTMMLLQAAEDDERAGNVIAAQQKFSQVATRLRYSRPEEAEHAQLRAYRTAGAALGVDESAAVGGGRVSPQLTERLQRYQREANLPVTGTLDDRTQETLLRRGATVVAQ